MKDEMVKHQASSALVVPDFLKGEHGGEGFDAMDKADVRPAPHSIFPRRAR